MLVFVDADVRLAPHAVAATVDLLRRTGLDLVCPYPRQLARDPRRAARPAAAAVVLAHDAAAAARRDVAAALARRRERAAARRRRRGRTPGPAATARSATRCSTTSPCCARSRRVGGTGGVVDGSHLATCRMYDGWAAVRGRLLQVAVVGVRLAARALRWRSGGLGVLVRRPAAGGPARLPGRARRLRRGGRRPLRRRGAHRRPLPAGLLRPPGLGRRPRLADRAVLAPARRGGPHLEGPGAARRRRMTLRMTRLLTRPAPGPSARGPPRVLRRAARPGGRRWSSQGCGGGTDRAVPGPALPTVGAPTSPGAAVAGAASGAASAGRSSRRPAAGRRPPGSSADFPADVVPLLPGATVTASAVRTSGDRLEVSLSGTSRSVADACSRSTTRPSARRASSRPTGAPSPPAPAARIYARGDEVLLVAVEGAGGASGRSASAGPCSGGAASPSSVRAWAAWPPPPGSRGWATT